MSNLLFHQAGVLARLWHHADLLETAITSLEVAYDQLRARYLDLHPAIIGNQMVPLSSRMACAVGFSPERGCICIETTFQKLKDNASLTNISLVYGFTDIAEMSLEVAEHHAERADAYLKQLEEAIDKHAIAEVWFRSRCLLGKQGTEPKGCSDPEAKADHQLAEQDLKDKTRGPTMGRNQWVDESAKRIVAPEWRWRGSEY